MPRAQLRSINGELKALLGDFQRRFDFFPLQRRDLPGVILSQLHLVMQSDDRLPNHRRDRYQTGEHHQIRQEERVDAVEAHDEQRHAAQHDRCQQCSGKQASG